VLMIPPTSVAGEVNLLRNDKYHKEGIN
jgi:hypothetical protein